MKRILLYIAFIQSITIFTGCEKELISYKGAEGVYFSVQHGDGTRAESSWPYQPYSNIDFVRIGLDVAEIQLKVAITGPVKDYDRIFHLEVNPDSTTAILDQHYKTIPRDWIIPAGAISANITVSVLRAPDLEEIPRTLGLRLVPSEDFALSFPEWDAIPSLDGGAIVAKFDASLHSLRINDIMVEPAEWNGSISSANREGGLFGAFTRKKMEFMIEHLGLTYQDFATPESMPLARMMLISRDAGIILMKRFNEKNPILEEDGRLMWFDSVTWTSHIGVPYVPVP